MTNGAGPQRVPTGLTTAAWLAVTAVLGLACGQAAPADPELGNGGIRPTTGNDATDTGAASSGDDDDDADGHDTVEPTDDDDSDDDASLDPPLFDVAPTATTFCQHKDSGLHCQGNVAVQCQDGESVSEESCVPDVCAPDLGCVTCTSGQNTCMGPHVMRCDETQEQSVWAIAETCDPSAGFGCDAADGACVHLKILGGVEPTGVYYQYAFFPEGDVFRGGYDVDSHGDRLYVNHDGAIDVYTITLLDSDEDGDLEPNQHPDNPDEPGAIEQRVLSFTETIPWPSYIAQSVSELYVDDDGLWVGGADIETMSFGGDGATSIITQAPPWATNLSHLGFDDVNQVWYAANEQSRRVLTRHADTDAWGIAFYFPSFAGDHMDGLEVVTQPDTGIPYVYISDMTSDFIAQYRLDAYQGWVQENVFSYEGTAGSLVEGLGYGAFNHFWATGGQYLYEVGGGDLAEFTEPAG